MSGNPEKERARRLAQAARKGRNVTETCECGMSKRPIEVCCARCSYLDGTSQLDSPREMSYELVGLLRETGHSGWTTRELAEELGVHEDSVQRVIKKLADSGRVRAYEGGESSFGGWDMPKRYRLREG